MGTLVERGVNRQQLWSGQPPQRRGQRSWRRAIGFSILSRTFPTPQTETLVLVGLRCFFCFVLGFFASLTGSWGSRDPLSPSKPTNGRLSDTGSGKLGHVCSSSGQSGHENLQTTNELRLNRHLASVRPSLNYLGGLFNKKQTQGQHSLKFWFSKTFVSAISTLVILIKVLHVPLENLASVSF